MTFNFLGPGLTVNVEAKVKEQIILDSSELKGVKYKTAIHILLILNSFCSSFRWVFTLRIQ